MLMTMFRCDKGLTNLSFLGGSSAFRGPFLLYFQILFGLCRDSDLDRLVEVAHTHNRQHVSQRRMAPHSHRRYTAISNSGDRPTDVMSAPRGPYSFHHRQIHSMPRLQVQQHLGVQARLQEKRDKIDGYCW